MKFKSGDNITLNIPYLSRLYGIFDVDNEYIFTFGFGQEYPNGYYSIHSMTCDKARETMFNIFGPRWAFQYHPPNARDKAGVEKFNLYSVNKLVNCNECGAFTDFKCARCNEPICENCAVQSTHPNDTIEETRCPTCDELYTTEY